jgi:hypothetical protein
MAKQNSGLQDKISLSSNTTLLDMIEKNPKNYTEEALEIANKEIQKRGGIEVVRTSKREEERVSQTDSLTIADSGIWAADMLRFCAWLDLVFSIVASIFILLHFERTISFIGIALAIFLQGIFICSLFLVIASIAENLRAIKRNKLPKSQL